MRLRRIVTLLVGLTMVAATFSTAGAQTPYPVIGDPVLRPDSEWIRTDWGFQHESLQFPDATRSWPTQFTMEGYAGATRPAPNAYLRMDDGTLIALRIGFGAGPRNDYASIQASIRGTNCSGGQFYLYDRRHAWDGHHIVEWAAEQPWSNGRVGMFGSSYPGQTAYWVATTQPPSLKAISSNLLHSDIYRDIFMPGGVQNILFPSLWTYGLGVVSGPHRIPYQALQNEVIPNDEICTQVQANRGSHGELPQPQLEPLWAGISATDNDWYAAHAALTYAPSIKIPYYQQNNWQDEQTGPRAAVLWHHIHPDLQTITDSQGNQRTVVPKKMVLSSGSHGFGGFAGRDRWAWFDIWLLDRPDEHGLLAAPVVNYFEAQSDGTSSATKSGAQWPFSDTDWTRIYLRGEGGLDFQAPESEEAGQTYVSGFARQNWFFYAPSGTASDVTTARGLPDAAAWESAPLGSDLAIAGPIAMDLYAQIAGTDADFFVSVSEVWPDGSVSYLQRGLLKASHRQVDPRRSYYAEQDGEQLRVQPYRPHTNPQPVVPGETVHYELEIFPVGHVFREGNQILIQVHTPPVTDGLWGYTPTHHQPALVQILNDADHPSSILLPVVQPDGAVSDPPQGCQIPNGFPCTPPSPLSR